MGETTTDDTPISARAWSAARAFGVMSGGPIVLLVLVAASVVGGGVALAAGDVPPWPTIVVIVATASYLVVFRPWSRRWGATRDEIGRVLPGDEVVAHPGVEMTRAVTIDAPVDAVWPWLAQIGQDRAAFYSYDWLENLAGCRLHNADRVHPEWQHREVGDTVLLHPAAGVRLARFEPNRAYAFEGGWHFALEALPEGRTRLLARSQIPRGGPSIAYALFIELPHFIMERKMLLGIKQRAEHASRGTPQARLHAPES